MKPFDEPLPKERSGAFAAFIHYRDMGPDRSIEAVSRKVSKNIQLIKNWSSAYDWVERALAWDAHLATISAKAQEDATRATAYKWAKRREEKKEIQYQRAQELFRRVDACLKFPLVTTTMRDGKTVVNPAKWTMGDLPRMIDIAERLERDALGIEPLGGGKDIQEINSPVNVTVNPVQFYIPLPKSEQECIAPDAALTAEEREARDTAIKELANRSAP